MATHSSVLAWRIPGTEEPGGLPSMGSHRVGQLSSSSSRTFSCVCEYLYKLELFWFPTILQRIVYLLVSCSDLFNS